MIAPPAPSRQMHLICSDRRNGPRLMSVRPIVAQVEEAMVILLFMFRALDERLKNFK